MTLSNDEYLVHNGKINLLAVIGSNRHIPDAIAVVSANRAGDFTVGNIWMTRLFNSNV